MKAVINKRAVIIVLTSIVFFLSVVPIHAKTDYKNPVHKTALGKLKIYINKLDTPVERLIYLATDKYNNPYLLIGVNFFSKKGEDVICITFNNEENTVIPVALSYKEKYYTGGKTYIPSIGVGRTYVGGHYRATVGTRFQSVYPLTKTQYKLVLDVGIQSISATGIYKIIYESTVPEIEE